MNSSFNFNWLSVIVAAFLIGMMLYGHYRGFLKMALSLAAVLITVMIAKIALPAGVLLLRQIGIFAAAEDYRVKLIAFILLFIVVWILLRIVIKFLDLFTKLPVIHGLNQIAGAVMGLIMGLVILWIIALVLVAFRQSPWAAKALEMIAESPFLSAIFSNNLLFEILKDTMQDIFRPIL